MRILFAGTPEFAATSLEALLAGPHDVIGVYTQPDRPAGRGRKPRPSPVKQLAIDRQLAVRQPTSLKEPEQQQALRDWGADLMVVVAYGLILPVPVLQAPRLGCINVHASLLPRWRGAAPIQRALLAGDAETGISIMQMDAGLDTGSVLATRATPIAADDTGGSLHDRLARMGAELLIQAVSDLEHGDARPVAQDDELATYAHKLSKQDAALDWRRPAAELERQIRAFNPWPVAHTRLGEQTVRVWEAKAEAGEGRHEPPGSVVEANKRGIVVACGDGLLCVTRLQLPGKRPVSAADLLNARPLPAGTRFSA